MSDIRIIRALPNRYRQIAKLIGYAFSKVIEVSKRRIATHNSNYFLFLTSYSWYKRYSKKLLITAMAAAKVLLGAK
jgi:hypothetical protein